MPQLSDSMEQGLVLQWLIADGAAVQIGDALLEIETDKATMTYQAEVAGTLRIVVPEGSTVSVGEVIATIGAEAPSAPEAPGRPIADDLAAPPAPTADGNGRTAIADPCAPATPVARRLAAVHGIELAMIHGTGPRGRITKSDVLGAAAIQAPLCAPKTAPSPAPRAPEPAPTLTATSGNDTRRAGELTRLQQVVARRMAESKSTIPHFQVQTEVAMGPALALRGELKSLAAGHEQPAPSLNDMIVKACAIALRGHPHANGSYRDGRFELHDRVNVGIAVAADGALVVPTVFDADVKSLGQVAADTRRLATRVRDGSATPPELSGATFTVSNLGMFGMTAIMPVINPPQAAILGVGAVRDALARDATGEIVDRPLLTITLSCDHRILYGADAARFLADVRVLLETPLRIAFG
jgi:pyruvate dehydrogenase E2 component (dihydrolipoamide acetyltransferase)